jgi:hypothetical protein
MDATLILIGPMGAGKGTAGRLLAAALDRPYRSLDELSAPFYAEAGYDEGTERRIAASEGLLAALRYREPFNLHAMERSLAVYPDSILDFGAGHAIYDDPGRLERARRLLAPYPHVVLLLPAQDEDEAVRLLHARRPLPTGVGFDLHRYAVAHPAPRALAKWVVYTGGKGPQETRDEVLALISR